MKMIDFIRAVENEWISPYSKNKCYVPGNGEIVFSSLVNIAEYRLTMAMAWQENL